MRVEIRRTKINELDALDCVIFEVNENVIRLDISMHDVALASGRQSA